MHESSRVQMARFVAKYLDKEQCLRILDVGAYDLNGTYRDLFTAPNWTYRGADLNGTPETNVHILLTDPYEWGIPPASFDVVVSGQTLEHVEDTHRWVRSVDVVLRAGGLVCLIAPWQWRIHRYPVDCWRILPDGMRFLLETVCRFNVLEAYVAENDCVGIAQKPA